MDIGHNYIVDHLNKYVIQNIIYSVHGGRGMENGCHLIYEKKNKRIHNVLNNKFKSSTTVYTFLYLLKKIQNKYKIPKAVGLTWLNSQKMYLYFIYYRIPICI